MQNTDVRNVSLGELLYFVKVVECGSLTQAAEYFHLGQPTLSKKIASLEVQTGLQLFIREKNKRLRPTPAGRHLYQRWRDLPQRIEGSLQEAHALQAGFTKTLTVAVLDSFRTDAFVRPAVEGFLARCPGVQLRIESNSAQQVRRMLIEGSADVAFSILYDFEGGEREHLDWRVFGRCPHCACMLRTNPLAGRRTLRVEELRRSRFVCISPQELPEYTRMVRGLCARHGFSPDISKSVSSAASLTLNITADDEVFLCDRYYREAENARLCCVPLEDTSSGFVLAWRREGDNPYAACFVDHCGALFGGD